MMHGIDFDHERKRYNITLTHKNRLIWKGHASTLEEAVELYFAHHPSKTITKVSKPAKLPAEASCDLDDLLASLN